VKRLIEIIVGLFMLAGLAALLVLAFQISGLTTGNGKSYYTITANFNNVGSLKVRSPVRIAGVRVGEVSAIDLNKQTFQAKVTMHVDDRQNKLPTDSSASIFTEGLLGANYVSLNPGFDNTYLKNGSIITNTHPALILENLVGQLLFKLKKK